MYINIYMLLKCACVLDVLKFAGTGIVSYLLRVAGANFSTRVVGKIDNCKFKFRTRFNMTRIKPSMQDSNILDSTNIISMISENIIMNWI